MQNKWKITKHDKHAMEKQQICFYCKHFFCTKYHHPSNRMVCSGILPQWEFLYRLMREVWAVDTCKNFKMHEAYKRNLHRYQGKSRNA